MKKILFLNSHTDIGGGERVLINFFKAVNRDKYDPLVTIPGPGPFQTELERIHVPVCKLRMSHSGGRGARLLIIKNLLRLLPSISNTVRKLNGIIRSENIHIIHANTMHSLVYAVIARRFNRVPIIWHCHEFYTYGRWGIRFIRAADHVITTSHALRRNLLEEGVPADRIKVAHCCVDPDDFNTVSPVHQTDVIPGWKQGDKIITTVGRLVRFKGQDVFIEAASLVRKQFPDTWFLIVGGTLFTDDTFLRHLSDLAHKKGVADRVIFLGQRDDVPAILTISDMIVLPSRAEPFGISVLEGMMAARPVIVTASSGAAELINQRKTGWIIPPVNPVIMADTILEILRNPKAEEQVGETAQSYVKENCTPAKMARNIEKVFESMK